MCLIVLGFDFDCGPPRKDDKPELVGSPESLARFRERVILRADSRSGQAMRIIFYQANFCAECGNAMKPRFSWRPRYFCDECEAQMGRRSYFKPAAGLLLCATLAVFALNRTRPPDQPNSDNQTSFVSARDTVTTRKSEPETATVERVLCGARTKKGTPCKRLVLPGQRCSQHRGMSSLLEKASGRAAPADDAKIAR
ncbi:MAG: hypothetical protein JMDDDDMK_05701 [Acidobacteria bacterium]|nr:hypothetical protein [Acidobacteriota bacterium]